MKDIGLGILDPYTVVIILITLVIAKVVFGYPIPLNTTDATQLFISLVVFTGYVYIARSIARLPVAVAKTLIIYFEKYGYYILPQRSHGFLRTLYWIIDLLITFLLLPLTILLSLLTIIINFSSQDFDKRFPSSQIKSLTEKKWLSSCLVFLDRLSVVLIAFLSTLPFLQSYVQEVGFIGAIFIIAIFLLKGNFSALLEDQLEKIADKKLEIKTQQEKTQIEEEKSSSFVNWIYTYRFGDMPVKISHCLICGKSCAENERGETTKICSLECSQKWFISWEKDWCIGDDKERELINCLRQSGYRDVSEIERVIKKLMEYPVNEEAVWALLAIIHDCDGLLLDFFERDRIRQLIVGTAERLSQVTHRPVDILNSGILDENEAVSEISAEMLATPYIDWNRVHHSKIEPLLRSRSLITRSVAIRILGEWKEVKRLVKLLETGSYDDRTKAGEALVSIGVPAISALKKAQKSSHIQLAQEATWVLNTINHKKETEVVKILDDEIDCPRCKRSTSITLKDEYKIVAAKGKFSLKWFFSKNKQKTKCSSCNSNIYLNVIPLQDWIKMIQNYGS